MTLKQYQTILAAESWRNGGVIDCRAVLPAWSTKHGTEAYCRCSRLHVHGKIGSDVIKEHRCRHCPPGYNEQGYYLALIPGDIPPEVIAAAKAWRRAMLVTGYRYSPEQLLEKARKQYEVKK